MRTSSESADAGAKVEVIAPQAGEIRGWNVKEWGDTVHVDRTVGAAEIDDYDVLVLPGGQINPDILRTDPKAVDFVRRFYASGKPTAAICHGPWMLVEADVVRDKHLTSYHSIRTDVRNAGGEWSDERVVVDGNLVTSRKPDDLPAFIDKIVEIASAR